MDNEESPVTVVAAMLLIGTATTPASADYTDCAQGSYCVWVDRQYAGSRAGATGNVIDYSKGTTAWKNVDNKGSSVFNNGKTSKIRAHVGVNYSGDYFLLSNPVLADGNPQRDPNLSNGAGYGSGALSTNWEDRLSSHLWF